MRDYLIGVASNSTFFFLLVLVGWCFVVYRRRHLLRFFGVFRNRRLLIYWSHLRVVPFGAWGIDNVLRSYQGSAVPFGEALVLPTYQRLFNSPVPGLDDYSGRLRRITLTDVRLESQVSPLTDTAIDHTSSILCLGSPGYNAVSQWIEEHLQSIARFEGENTTVVVPGLAPFADPLHGFVQRVRITNLPTFAFYLAGMSELATISAAHLLASRWDYFRARFGDRENFCVVLRANPENPQSPRIILERGEN